MSKHRVASGQILFVLAALLCAAGVWICARRVLIPHQRADAAAHGRPRGNLSDLYPRWLGARELLLHGRDPYSPEVTREIQEGFYGRVLDPARPEDPRDQEGFAYPTYVVFFLAPTLHLPFETVRKGFFWFLVACAIAAVPLWLRVLGWPLPWWAQGSAMIFAIGSLPIMQGLKLNQMTLFVALLIAAAIALFVSDHPIPAGVLLAMATIKPQHVWLLLLWLTVWTVSDWRRRYRWLVSFLLTMAVLFAASEFYLPHWIPRFLHAVHEYRNYSGAASVLDKLFPQPWSWLLQLLIAAATAQVCWKNRRSAQGTQAFAVTVALVLAATVTLTIVPSYALYNQAMLLPAVLLIVRERHTFWARNRLSRLLLSLVAILLVWPWPVSIVLACLSYFFPLSLLEPAWAVPYWTVLPLPLGVAALVLVRSYQSPFPAPSEAGAS
jgi:hypothetical protein